MPRIEHVAFWTTDIERLCGFYARYFGATPAPGAERQGLTHVAISVGSDANVDALAGVLRADGHAVLDGPRRTGDGYYEAVVLDPDGNRVEITA